MASAPVRILSFNIRRRRHPTHHLSAPFLVLIAYRLWTRQGTMRDSRKAFGLTREARIMAESGAIYAVTVILIIATYTGQSNSFNVFLDSVSKTPHPPYYSPPPHC
jgi:hypothetical protein